jgi:proteasome lid subunit RPN8/RPN11
MSEIEWNSDAALEPASLSMESFCKARGLPCPQAGDGSYPIVFIAEAALEGLHAYLESDLSREHGGVLVGHPFRDPVSSHYFVDIRAAIPAINSEGSPVHLQFNAEAWDYISGLLEESFPDHVLLGWYHSHPGLGVFMSGTDQDTHRAFYYHLWNLALVVDPVLRRSGWFAGPECLLLGKDQVILYGPKSDPDLEEQGLPTRHPWKDLRWFLPAVLLGLALLVLLLAGQKQG